MREILVQWRKIKHKVGKDGLRNFRKQKAVSISSASSCHSTPSTVRSPDLPSVNLQPHGRLRVHEESPRTLAATVDATSQMESTPSASEDGFVVVPQNYLENQILSPSDQDSSQVPTPTQEAVQVLEIPESGLPSREKQCQAKKSIISQDIGTTQGTNALELTDRQPHYPVENNLSPESRTVGDENPFPDSPKQGITVPDAQTEEIFEENAASLDHQSFIREIVPVASPQAMNQPKETLLLDSLEKASDTTDLNNFVREMIENREKWNILRTLRQISLGARSSLQKQRTVLQEKEKAKEVADDAFIKYTRENTPPNSTFLEEKQKILDKRYAELQHTRNEYGPAFVEYMQRTEALDNVEFEMARIESHLYKILFGDLPEDTNLPPDFSQEATAEAAASSPSPWLGLVAGIQDRFEPLQSKYLSRLGDWDLAKERLDTMEQEMEDLLDQKQSLLNTKRELGDELIATLGELPAQMDQLRSEIQDIRADVERIRQECVEQGVDLDSGSDDGSGSSLSLYGDDSE